MDEILPLTVELVGPSGSGKTSLGRALVALDGGTVASVNLHSSVGAARRAWNALRAAGPFVSQCARMPSRPCYRYITMIQLQSYHDMLRRWRSRCTVALLDQGPVYLLSILQRALRSDGGANARSFQRYWDAALDAWAHTLRMVVVLDGPNEVLRERILRRGTPHPFFNVPVAETAPFFARGRESQDRIVTALRKRNADLAVLKIQVGDLTPDEVARRVHVHLVSLLRPPMCGA